ncbi:hypothetical protein [Nonomuraea sp. NPDC049158]|uniref:hypothetical protein n=1 Tax=Nonomuraea sp. NPDC049158 TaxID=3155649 RepID=UPI0033EF32C4
MWQLNPSVSTGRPGVARRAGARDCSATRMLIWKCWASKPKLPATPQQPADSCTIVTPAAWRAWRWWAAPRIAYSWQWVWTATPSGARSAAGRGRQPAATSSVTVAEKPRTREATLRAAAVPTSSGRSLVRAAAQLGSSTMMGRSVPSSRSATVRLSRSAAARNCPVEIHVRPQHTSLRHSTESAAVRSTRAAAPATCGRKPLVKLSTTSTSPSRPPDGPGRPSARLSSRFPAKRGRALPGATPPSRARWGPSRVASSAFTAGASRPVTRSHRGSQPRL